MTITMIPVVLFYIVGLDYGSGIVGTPIPIETPVYLITRDDGEQFAVRCCFYH
jgi:hypothetical protein